MDKTEAMKDYVEHAGNLIKQYGKEAKEAVE